MNKKRMSSVVSAIVCVLFTASIFAGFTMAKAPKQSVTYNLGVVPKTIDISLNTALDGSNVIQAAFEGLTVTDANNKIVPGVAESWKISKDGKVYTFKLRKNAKWSDGKQVTANDFYFSWMRLLNPKTMADYVTQMFYVKNAEEYYNYTAGVSKKKVDIKEVGLKVVDAQTFQVTLKAPTAFFLALCAWSGLCPQREDIVSKDPTGWATKVAGYVGNGPFKLTEWVNKDHMTFVKNPNYWNKSKVKLDELKMVMIVDSTVALQAWEKGEIDVINTFPTTEVPRLLSEKKISVHPILSSSWVTFNMKKYPMNNLKFRQAMSYAIDRTAICRDILKGGQKPSVGIQPFGMIEPSGKDFRTTKSYAVSPATPNIEKAKQLLKESKVDLTKTVIKYAYNTNPTNKKIAEVLQAMWATIGVKVELQQSEWGVFQAQRQSGNYDIARYAWIGDYPDPMTFADLFLKANGNNDAKYFNLRYEGLVKAAQNEPNPVTRMKYLHQAEDQLMADLPGVPINYGVSQLSEKASVKGVYTVSTGSVLFDRAYVK
jgi:oligopeptide transport system substrate-binding protein